MGQKSLNLVFRLLLVVYLPTFLISCKPKLDRKKTIEKNAHQEASPQHKSQTIKLKVSYKHHNVDAENELTLVSAKELVFDLSHESSSSPLREISQSFREELIEYDVIPAQINHGVVSHLLYKDEMLSDCYFYFVDGNTQTLALSTDRSHLKQFFYKAKINFFSIVSGNLCLSNSGKLLSISTGGDLSVGEQDAFENLIRYLDRNQMHENSYLEKSQGFHLKGLAKKIFSRKNTTKELINPKNSQRSQNPQSSKWAFFDIDQHKKSPKQSNHKFSDRKLYSRTGETFLKWDPEIEEFFDPKTMEFISYEKYIHQVKKGNWFHKSTDRLGGIRWDQNIGMYRNGWKYYVPEINEWLSEPQYLRDYENLVHSKVETLIDDKGITFRNKESGEIGMPNFYERMLLAQGRDPTCLPTSACMIIGGLKGTRDITNEFLGLIRDTDFSDIRGVAKKLNGEALGKKKFLPDGMRSEFRTFSKAVDETGKGQRKPLKIIVDDEKFFNSAVEATSSGRPIIASIVYEDLAAHAIVIDKVIKKDGEIFLEGRNPHGKFFSGTVKQVEDYFRDRRSVSAKLDTSHFIEFSKEA